ncbi:MAG: Cof-type HAD-IIB family hydrolase [Bacilli bacterium]|nr:Cof-type HAD-IIB family hydrolase [Bacilli bacterium]
MMKMIVTDLDGTLLNEMRKPSEETKKYLMKLKEQGYIIVIATGRIYISILEATDGANFANYLIADTGACTYNLKGAPLFQNIISKEIVEKVLDYYSDDCRFIDICDKNMIYKYSKTEIENTYFVKTVTNKEEILNKNLDVSHISIAMKANHAVLELYEILKTDFPELEILIMQDSFKDNQWIEITKKGVSKYHAVSQLADYLGIKNEEIIAFGDGLNDIDMIANCGYGVALKNALPEVKNVAHDVTLFDNCSDGVIHYLQNIIEEKVN